MSNLQLEIKEKNKVVSFNDEISYMVIPNRHQLKEIEVQSHFNRIIKKYNSPSIEQQKEVLNKIRIENENRNKAHWNQIYKNQRNILKLRHSYNKPTYASLQKRKLIATRKNNISLFFTR